MNANGIDARDIPGEKGQFDVLRDGELVFSKQQQGRFPADGEVLGAVRG